MFDRKQNEEDVAWALAWQQGDRGAAERLLWRYRPLIHGMRKNAVRGEDWEDLRQDLILEFLKAAKAYDPGKNPSFSGYIVRYIRWRGIDAFNRRLALVSHEELTLEDQEEPGAVDQYPAESEAALTAASAAAGLTDEERQVLGPWTEGLGIAETSRLTGLSTRTIKRLRHSIRGRFAQHREETQRILAGEA